MTDCYDRATGSGAYALNALSAEEAAEFEAALAESEDLRAEVAGFVDTAGLLALAAPPVEPSAALKGSLLAALDGAPQPATEEHSATKRAHVAPRRARSPRRRALLALVAAVAAVLLFAGGALAGSLLGGGGTADRFAALNAAPDVVRLTTPLPEGGSASVVASAKLGMSAVVLNDAARLPAGKTFQVWYVEKTRMASAGTVQPAGGTVYRMLGGHYKGEQIAMTIEPEGGSPAPTTQPMLLS